MKETIMTSLLIGGIMLIALAKISHAEWLHQNPADLSVTHAKIGNIVTDVHSSSIDVSFTEERLQYYLENGNKKCRIINMGASHKTFRDDPATGTYDYSRMLQWVAGHIGEGFVEAAESKLAEELGDVPVIWVDPLTLCYVTNGTPDVVAPQ